MVVEKQIYKIFRNSFQIYLIHLFVFNVLQIIIVKFNTEQIINAVITYILTLSIALGFVILTENGDGLIKFYFH